jgi:hypothetical protein
MASRLLTNPNAKSYAILAIVVGFIALQTAVPIVKLFEPRPSRFGWQMYSGERPQPSFAVLLSDGRRESVDISPFIGQGRSEIELVPAIPDHLCSTIAGAVSVDVIDATGTLKDNLACR